MSFAATRMMAAARRAYHSEASTVKEVLRSFEAVDKANLVRLPQLLDPSMRQGAAQDVRRNTRRIKLYANPYSYRGPPPDGDIWYDVAWAKNLGVVLIVTSWFGIYHVLAEERQQSDHMSSSLPMPPS